MSAASLSDDDELLAAELAFGLIDGPERQAAEARIADDPALAAAHARWQDHAAAVFADPGEAPRPSVWNAIVARLPANDVAPVASRAALRWWQAGTLAASAAAVVLGLVAVQKPATVVREVRVASAPAAPMVAVLSGKQGVATVSFDPVTRRMTAAMHGVDIGDHAPELWVIPADGRPRPMGVVHAAAPSWGPVPDAAAAAMAEGVTIAVSVEPVGGSPTGLPTGPVILTGKMQSA